MTSAHDWILDASFKTIEAEFIDSGYTPQQAAQLVEKWKQAITPKTEGK
jgi:hypothetical protein